MGKHDEMLCFLISGEIMAYSIISKEQTLLL